MEIEIRPIRDERDYEASLASASRNSLSMVRAVRYGSRLDRKSVV